MKELALQWWRRLKSSQKLDYLSLWHNDLLSKNITKFPNIKEVETSPNYIKDVYKACLWNKY